MERSVNQINLEDSPHENLQNQSPRKNIPWDGKITTNFRNPSIIAMSAERFSKAIEEKQEIEREFDRLNEEKDCIRTLDKKITHFPKEWNGEKREVASPRSPREHSPRLLENIKTLHSLSPRKKNT